MNFTLGVGNKKHDLQFHFFFLMKLIVIDPFMSQNTVSMTFFTDCCAQNFYLLESQCVSISWTVFLIHACRDKSMFSLFVNLYFY